MSLERRSPGSQMSDPQFREFTLSSLKEGRERFDLISDSIEKLTAKVDENTAITKQNADDLADMLRVWRFGKQGASIIKQGTEGGSKLIKVLMPWVFIVGLGLALYHGDKISIRQILEWMK